MHKSRAYIVTFKLPHSVLLKSIILCSSTTGLWSSPQGIDTGRAPCYFTEVVSAADCPNADCPNAVYRQAISLSLPVNLLSVLQPSVLPHLSSFQVQDPLWEGVYGFGSSGGASWSWVHKHVRDLTSKVNLTISCYCLKFNQLEILRGQLELWEEKRRDEENNMFHKSMSTLMMGYSFNCLPYWPQLLSVRCRNLHLLLFSA